MKRKIPLADITACLFIETRRSLGGRLRLEKLTGAFRLQPPSRCGTLKKPVPRIAGVARTKHRRLTQRQFNGHKYINTKMKQASPTIMCQATVTHLPLIRITAGLS